MSATNSNSISVEQLRAEWTEHARLAYWIIHRRLKSILDRYDDEQVGEAVALAWTQYVKCRQRVDDVRKAVSLAARAGVWRVAHGRRFIARERGYLDAMDVRGKAALVRLAGRGESIRHRAECGFIDPAEIPARDEQPVVFDHDDRAGAESLIESLPADLQPTARLLSYGMPRKLVAERRGVSLPTVCRQVERIRESLVGCG